MAKIFDSIDARLADFIRSQHVFFVGTAPTGPDGHVNVSPKGLDTFSVLGPREVAYLDLTGSGIETIAHVRDNSRIVIMFCAFEGAPKILRLHGRGEVIEGNDPRFAELRGLFGEFVGVRSIIRVDVERIADSCGFGVPQMAYEADRDTLGRWAQTKGEQGVRDYREEVNARSIDGLAGLPSVASRS